MNQPYYYAQIDDDGICCGVSQLSGEVDYDNMIQLESYDMSLMGKLWTGTEWIENPNPPDPPEPVEEVTNEDLQALELASMQGQADQYTTMLELQQQLETQQQLMLANMQGMADVYTTLLSMQGATGTEE